MEGIRGRRKRIGVNKGGHVFCGRRYVWLGLYGL